MKKIHFLEIPILKFLLLTNNLRFISIKRLERQTSVTVHFYRVSLQ